MSSHEFDIDWSFFVTIETLLSFRGKQGLSLLDIGSGAGVHSEIFRKFGFEVISLDKYAPASDVKLGVLDYEANQRFDVIFCSHVIEHQRNVGLFLDRISDLLDDDGLLVMSAPKHPATTMIEGHINSMVLPLLLQHLIYAGFDVKDGKFLSCFGVENSVICRKHKNFSIEERGEDAFSWRNFHRERSFIELKNCAIDNDKPFFYNCDHWFLDKAGKLNINVDNADKIGLTIKSSRLGLSITV